MNKDLLSAALAVSLLCVGGIAAAQSPPVGATQTTVTTTTIASPPDALDQNTIKTDIANAGYKEVKDLKFDDGVWQAKARGGNDHWVSIRIGPRTGKVYEEDAPSKLDQNEIKAALTTQGYRNIHDVKFDDGLWKADADNQAGASVDLLVDPDDGSVVAFEHD